MSGDLWTRVHVHMYATCVKCKKRYRHCAPCSIIAIFNYPTSHPIDLSSRKWRVLQVHSVHSQALSLSWIHYAGIVRSQLIIRKTRGRKEHSRVESFIGTNAPAFTFTLPWIENDPAGLDPAYATQHVESNCCSSQSPPHHSMKINPSLSLSLCCVIVGSVDDENSLTLEPPNWWKFIILSKYKFQCCTLHISATWMIFDERQLYSRASVC